MNRCGDCFECCKACVISEINKPAGILCENYKCGGCSIYSGRPKDCETYQCVWVTQDNIDVKYRPDHLKVIFEQPYGKSYWVGIELETNSLQKEDCAKLVRAMNNDGASVMLKSIDGKFQYSLPAGKSIDDFKKEIE